MTEISNYIHTHAYTKIYALKWKFIYSQNLLFNKKNKNYSWLGDLCLPKNKQAIFNTGNSNQASNFVYFYYSIHIIISYIIFSCIIASLLL